MADNFTINVNENFDMDRLCAQLQNNFRSKGFSVTAARISTNACQIVLDKGCGGINMLLGMGEGITANCTLNGNCLYVTYSDGDWTGKIIGLAVGWILCFIPFITAIIGCVNQSGLPKKVNNEVAMIVAGMNN